MQGFTLLQDDTIYLENKTEVGSYIGGKWIEGSPEITYTEVDAIYEPYTKSLVSYVLPEGVKSSDSQVIFSEYNLKVHNDLGVNSRVADIVYFEDPETNTHACPYIVFDKDVWKANKGFTLLSEDYSYYIAIRQDKLPT